MSFDLYPAIDIREGRCVRLRQGDYDREVRYDSDPVDVALSFEAAGASWIHVVDLDAARSGIATNREVIRRIVDAVRVPVQSGGGIRSVSAAQALFDTGVARCVLGTAAIESPDLADDLVSLGFRVAVGLDVRGEEVAIRGWEIGSGKSIFEVLPRFENTGVEAVIVTQINNDGMGDDADLEGLNKAMAATELTVIASGGVGSLADIERLASLVTGERRLGGVIVGKAIHDGKISINEALISAGCL
ncbi:MAG: 1-(5-phosphoribosyl)-5-[(5-phosphoribosylamino)methylideneamino]imidazole-4-carboxamide isomerase [Actinobacteria bacterium]|nr:1-(5-phosphoribosyl)-5-[(5-phosphoribosylamino)methylideneamino]imidazole-4-carboxamide isomerase [Actinomycetota bacterium]